MIRLLCLLCLTTPALAEAPHIDAVDAIRSGSDWRIDVTLTHPDTGWEHHADGWRVEDAAGRPLGMRELTHPHVTEQPFTRSLTVAGPLPVRVFLRTRCNRDGWSNEREPVNLPD